MLFEIIQLAFFLCYVLNGVMFGSMLYI